MSVELEEAQLQRLEVVSVRCQGQDMWQFEKGTGRGVSRPCRAAAREVGELLVVQRVRRAAKLQYVIRAS